MMSAAPGDAHRLEGGDVRRSGKVRGVPRQDHREQEDRADEEDRDPHDHRVGRLARSPCPGSGDSAAAMVATSAPTIEKITTTMAAKIAPEPEREEAAMRREVAEVEALVRPQRRARTARPSPGTATIAATLMPANQNSNSPNERHREQVGRGHQRHQDERQQPQRDVRCPELEHLGARDRLEADHDDPEVPVQPRRRRSRPSRPARCGHSRRTNRSTGSPRPSRPASASP